MTAMPDAECDLVMRGGIASGIVYPEAIAGIAAHYRLRAIGGTSAGAIAAAIAAAAEYGRQSGKRQGAFEVVRRQAQYFAGRDAQGRSRIVSLFAAPRETRLLLNLLLASQGSDWAAARLDPLTRRLVALAGQAGCVKRALVHVGGTPATGALAALFVPTALLALLATLGGPAGALLAIVLLVGAIGLPALALSRLAGGVLAATDALPANLLGICTGLRPDDESEPGLTEWMHTTIQDAAGLAPGEPLTFGHLRGLPPDRSITLQLMTTNVTRGTSARLPDLEDTRRGVEHFRGRLYFRASELAQLLPPEVLAWMVAKAPPLDLDDRAAIGAATDFHRLPAPEDLPVVLAARMSLSFPVLLSQVPLWAPDPLDAAPRLGALVRCWFTDGGITSNFPINIFDGPLPRRPTFGINLVPLIRREVDRMETPAMRKRVRMPVDENDYVITRLDDPATTRTEAGIAAVPVRSGLAQLVRYFGLINDTARNWAETELATMPGYRDRIVHVELSAAEGGLNLDMPEAVIRRVAERGRIAAEALLARYHPDGPKLDPLTERPAERVWERHRWVRTRAFLAAFEELSRKFLRGWRTPGAMGAADYPTLLRRDPPEESRYRWQRPDQADWARRAAPAVVEALGLVFPSGDPREAGTTFDRGDGVEPQEGRSPRPKVVLRIGQPRGHDPADSFTPLDPARPPEPTIAAAGAGGPPAA